MARDGLFFRRAGTLNAQQRPRLRAGRCRRLDGAPLPHRHVRPAARLRDLRGAALLRASRPSGCSSCARKRPDAERPYRAFGYPVLPALYIVLCCGVMVLLLLSPTTRDRRRSPGSCSCSSASPCSCSGAASKRPTAAARLTRRAASPLATHLPTQHDADAVLPVDARHRRQRHRAPLRRLPRALGARARLAARRRCRRSPTRSSRAPRRSCARQYKTIAVLSLVVAVAARRRATASSARPTRARSRAGPEDVRALRDASSFLLGAL